MDLLQFKKTREEEKVDTVAAEIKKICDANGIKFVAAYFADDYATALTNFKFRHESIGAAKLLSKHMER